MKPNPEWDRHNEKDDFVCLEETPCANSSKNLLSMRRRLIRARRIPVYHEYLVQVASAEPGVTNVPAGVPSEISNHPAPISCWGSREPNWLEDKHKQPDPPRKWTEHRVPKHCRPDRDWHKLPFWRLRDDANRSTCSGGQKWRIVWKTCMSRHHPDFRTRPERLSVRAGIQTGI